MAPPLLALPRALAETLFRTADAGRWGLSRDEFASALGASAGKAFAAATPGDRELEKYLTGLHLADLALATACALGRDAAWDHFMREHRPVLYRAADALDPGGGARELADSLYADLYGLPQGAAERRSLFRYFHGRSSLATWLRAVLAQRHIDAIRARKRVEPLPDDDWMAARQDARPDDDQDRARLVPLVVQALAAAIAALAARDRLRLRGYYGSQLTLAEIGRITGEHEATVSRQLAKTRQRVRAELEQHLRDKGLTEEQVARAVELAIADTGTLDLQQVLNSAEPRKESPRDRSS